MAARGLTRRITRRQARSYKMTSPNPGMGVTAIASVNRHRKTRGGPRSKEQIALTLREVVLKSKRKGVTKADRKHLQRKARELRQQMRAAPNYARSYARTKKLLGGKAQKKETSMRTTRRRRARRNYSAREMNELFEQQMAASKPKKKKRMTKARRAQLARARAAAQRKRVGKRYGKFTSLRGRVGTSTVPTYAYRGKSGRPKKIPLWAILGSKSKKSFERRVADSPALARKVVAAKKRRERKAQKLLLSGDFFTPNPRRRSRRRVVPYETWSKNMTKNRRARSNKRRLKGAAFKRTAQYRKMRAGLRAYLAKKGGKRSGRSRAKRGGTTRRAGGRRKARSAAQRRATARMLRARWGKKVRRRKAWKNVSSKSAIPNRRRRRRKARRNQPIMQAAANRSRRRRRKARRNTTITQAAANPRRRRRRKARRNQPITQAAANRRRRRKSRRNPATPNRRRRRKARRNQMLYTSNRRRRGSRRKARRNQMLYTSNRRRRYRRNPGLVDQLKTLLKVGAKMALGFMGHRALTYVVSEHLLNKVEIFSTGSLSEYRGIIGGAIAAVGGVAAVSKFAPNQAAQIGAGIMTSLVHATIVAVLKKVGQPDVAGYLAAYPDAEGHAYHSMAGYGGYGSYELVPGMSGMGEYDYYNQYSGLGQLTQAAAGMGEYFMPGLQGIGEYEAVEGYGALGQQPYTDEGIHPNLNAAEHALTVAEAAAGVGDLPLQSTVDPYQVAAPIMDGPTGSRAGILEGGDGIFG